MTRDLIYFLLLIAPIVTAFVVLTHETDLPKERAERRGSPFLKG